MITLQELKTHFEYNPLTGVFIRLTSSKGHRAGEHHYMGTTFCKRAQKWISQCTLNGVTKYVGSFDTAEEASKAYLKVKQDMHKYFNK